MSESSGVRMSDDAIRAGWAKAQEEPVAGWYIFGLLLAIVAVPWVYLHRPRDVPVTILADLSDITESGTDPDRQWFERAFLERLHKRQKNAVWLGAITVPVLLVGLPLVMLVISGVASFVDSVLSSLAAVLMLAIFLIFFVTPIYWVLKKKKV